MKQLKLINYKILTLLIIIFLGFLFRYINLDWGAPYFFHPDERNIASSISRLSYKNDLNPKFFAYGSLPIYTIYFTGVAINLVEHSWDQTIEIDKVNFEDAILIGRVFSFIASLALIFVIYKITLLIKNQLGAIISVLLALFSIGLIQYSHYATFEMWISLLTSLLCYLTLLYYKKKNIKYFLLSSFIIGLMISVKVSSLVFVPTVLLVFTFYEAKKILHNKTKLILLRNLIYGVVCFSAIATITVFITSPYYWLDNSSFRSSISYESSVALGTLNVFYTQFFKYTTPGMYQLEKVYPFILNPFVLITAVIAFFYVSLRAIISKKTLYLIFLLFFATTFISQAFLYVKWVRYYIPTLPFIYICIGILFSDFIKNNSQTKKPAILIATLIIFISIIYSLSFVKTVYINKDTRIEAVEWAKANIASDAAILSEVYDMGIVPFNKDFDKIKLFNFYELDNDPLLVDELAREIRNSEYIILPSQRIISSRLSMPKEFPKGYAFYNSLMNGKDYYKVYETKCDIFCKLIYWHDPIQAFEQTANVFDRPTLMIFKSKNSK